MSKGSGLFAKLFGGDASEGDTLDEKTKLHESAFQAVEELLQLPLPSDLKQRYASSDSNGLDVGYMPIVDCPIEEDAVIKLLPINPSNYRYSQKYLTKDKDILPLGLDDFGNFYLLKAPNWEVTFLDLQAGTPPSHRFSNVADLLTRIGERV